MSPVLVEAFHNLLSFQNLLFINLGMFIGIIFGAIPGLNGNLAITVLLPFTFSLGTVPAILLLTAIFFGSNFGGSISAILINTPGTNAAAATLLDGYPLAHIQNKPRKALDVALLASTFGGIVSALCLLFFAPQISKVAMKFGPPEYFALAIFGLSIIASVSGKSILKGLIMGAFGVLLSTMGMDTISGNPRFTFHNLTLYNGVGMLAVLLGVYAISQMLARINGSEKVHQLKDLKKRDEDDRLTKQEKKHLIPTMLRSSLIGSFIGAIPGTGGAIAAFISYNQAQNRAKPGEHFGKGEIKGIAAPESANNGATAATLIPLLTLGIPGDVVSATLAGAFTMQGLIVGPRLFINSGPTVYAILLGCLITQIFILIQGRYLLPVFVKITRVPQDLLTTILIVVCCAGAFAISDSSFDLKVMLIFGVLAYFFMKVDLPPVPIVLGIVLGPIAEENFRNSLVMSKGSWSIFVTRPISLLFIVLTFIFIYLLKKNEKKEAQAAEEFKRTTQGTEEL
ncbi:MAG: tripartite tricarboxylate transporter permease [Spirochaetia bacterium]|jgi:putative tricarboxylic transport membrane protein|nr:tripartite tricarboxylate transporter permease [Spirochaetia bacterium]